MSARKVTDDQVRAQWQRLMDFEPELTQHTAAAEIGIADRTLREHAKRLGLPKLRSIQRTSAGRAAAAANVAAWSASPENRTHLAAWNASPEGKAGRAAGHAAQRKITDEQVELVRREWINNPNLTLTAAAREFGIDPRGLGQRLGLYDRGDNYPNPHLIVRKPREPYTIRQRSVA